jgi:dTDP-4-amino-4,6-dideoxygalactose transaminase
VKYNIPFIRPSFPDSALIAEDVRSIVASNWFTNFGPFEKKFREEIKLYLGDSQIDVVTVSNATVGIDIAVRALFLGDVSRNEVLVPSFTFAAGPEVLISHGLTPVFVDIDEESWQPSLSQAEKYLERNNDFVAGILLGNSFGVGSPGIEEWEQLSSRYSLPLIIDSAAGFGSIYEDGSKVGTKGTCEVFSFHATKPFAIGEGGAITTKDKKLAAELYQLENFGYNDNKEIVSIGTNAKLEEISCAIGLRQLQGYDERINARQLLLKHLQDLVAERGNRFQSNDTKSSIPFMSLLMSNSETAGETLNSLNTAGIIARKYYSPVHKQGMIMRYAKIADSLSVTEEVYSRIISLPLHDSMTKEVIEQMADFL